MARSYKCPVCGEKDYEENMVIDYIGKVKKRFHKVCHDQYLKDQEFKRKEKEELDNLVETIKRIHEIEIIPNQFFTYLQDIRNGNELFGKIGQKRSKQGYTYKIIEETYKQHVDSIRWAKSNRDFNGDAFNFLKYTLAIVRKKIASVNYQIENRERKKEIEKATEKQAINTFEHTNRQPVRRKKNKSKIDASSFLD